MYGYLENEELHRAPNPLAVDDAFVWNPTDSQYETAGYKKIIFSDPPKTEIGYHAESYWDETSAQIFQRWVIVEDPDEVDPAEAWEYIFGGDEE